jgi:tetratricopeptide (TPR) repeat protein
VQFYRGETAEALATQRRAADLNPNNAKVRAQLGWRLAFTEDWDGGMAQVREAARQSMAGRGWYYLVLAIDDYRRADYRAALADLERLAGPFFFLRPALQAMCEAGLGNPERARRALQEARALDPSFARDPRAAFRLHRTPEDLIERFIDGLRAAGLEIPRGQT